MPTVSRRQFAFMQMCRHSPQHARGKCPSAEVAKEFTRGQSPKGLPERAPRRKK